jgi:pSer/pThr/pTyr-binding forkhead associated (FHA) protein
VQQSLAVGQRTRGIVVDARMRTSAPNILSAGDCAELGGRVLQLWEPARHMARVAAFTMTGQDAAYAPGVHYFATRLFDLDFASLGEVVAAPGVEALVDYPKRTGSIRYVKLLLKGDRLVGALMLGQVEERVRQRGRAFKRLIDERVDIGPIKDKLLDATFDLSGWLRANALVAKPKEEAQAPQGKAFEPPKKMRATRAISLAELPTQLAPPSVAVAPAGVPALGATGAAPAPRAMPQTALVAAMPSAPIAARIEGGGRAWAIDADPFSIGSDKECGLRLEAQGVSHVHAQVSRYGDDLYLRDLGTASGTWANGRPVVMPHRLADGDRLRIGNVELLVRIEGGAARAEAARGSSLPAQAALVPYLEVRTGRSLGLAFALDASPVFVGRDPQCKVRLDDPAVAPRHVQLREAQGRFYACDVSGGWGLWRNGGPVPQGQEVPLGEGDTLQLGDVHVAFTTAPRRAQHVRKPHPSQVPDEPSWIPPQGQAPAQAQAQAQAQAPARMRRARVVIRSGAAQGHYVEIGARVLLGSQAGACHLVLADPNIAPQHLELVRAPDGVWARDLGSGATFRAGQPMRGPQRLASGDTLVLGRGTALVFEEEA